MKLLSPRGERSYLQRKMADCPMSSLGVRKQRELQQLGL